MRLYVAGASAEMNLCDAYMKRLRLAGHEIAADWVDAIRKAGAANPTELEVMRPRAQEDLQGVRDCALFWLLIPATKTIGAWVELGYAHAHGIHIIVSGGWEATIFSSLATHRFRHHEDAFRHITGMPAIEPEGARA